MKRQELQEMFPMGCNVRRSAHAAKRGILRCADPDTYTGKVVGHSWRRGTLLILRPNRRPQTYHWSFWERTDCPTAPSLAPNTQIEEHW